MLPSCIFCVAGMLIAAASCFATPAGTTLTDGPTLSVAANAVTLSVVNASTPPQLSPRQATLRVRGLGKTDVTYHLQHPTHRPVQYTLALSNKGVLVANYEALVSRDGGQTWHQLPSGAFTSDAAVLPWHVNIRGYETVIVEVKAKATQKSAKEAGATPSSPPAASGVVPEAVVPDTHTTLKEIVGKLNDIDKKLSDHSHAQPDQRLQQQIESISSMLTEIKSAMQQRQNHVGSAISSFLLAPDSVRISGKAQISGQSLTRVDWVTHPTNLRISGPKSSAGIAFPATPSSAFITLWLKSSAHPQGQKLITLPAKFVLSGEELLTDIGFLQTIAQPLEAALIEKQCLPGRYQVVIEIELSNGTEKLAGQCGNVLLLEVTP